MPGSGEATICIDDLMISARSKNMSDKGFRLTKTDKKAAGYGYTFDIGTFSILRLVVTIVGLVWISSTMIRTKAVAR
jgi:hypothetical protein